MKQKFTKSILLALMLFLVEFATGQIKDTIVFHTNARGTLTFARFLPSNKRLTKDSYRFLKDVLNMGENDSLILKNETKDTLNYLHRRYQQYYKGIKVESAEFLTHSKNDTLEVVNGNFENIAISSIIPAISDSIALAKALSFVNAKQYAWKDTAFENYIQNRTDNLTATYYPKAELVISKDYIDQSKNFKLAWKFKIVSISPYNAQLIYVDAQTGNIISQIPLIYDVNTNGTAQTKYSGNQSITFDSYSSSYRLRETRNGVTIETLNEHNTDLPSSATDFTNSSTSWASGNWTNFSQDQPALDAHWAEEKVVDFWETVFNRNSINGSGMSEDE